MFGLGSDVGRGCTHARNPDGSASGAAGYCSRLFCHKPRATTRGSILRSCHRSWSLPVGWMWWWRSGTVNSSLCACIEFASVHRCQNALVDLLAYASALACPITIFANEQWPPLLLADFRERWTQARKCASSLGSAALPSHTGAERGGFRCFCSQILDVMCVAHRRNGDRTAWLQKAPTTASSDGCSA
jgi:hypothetical protein